MKNKKFVKYFHELTKEEYAKLCRQKPPITYGDLAKMYPQPKWCNYPGATYGMVGCWSLVDFMVEDEKYCKKCECYRKVKK